MSKEFATERLERLIAGCKANDRTAQEELYNLYYKELYYMAYGLLKDKQRAEEAVNNGFLVVFKKIHLYTNKGSFEGWLKKCVYRKSLNYLNETNKFKKDKLDRSNDQLVNNEGYTQPCINIYNKDILNLFFKLPVTTRKVVNLAADGYTHKEIGDLLNMSHNTSKWHLSTGRQILKDLLIKLN